MHKTTRRGFTLVELMVVISIIAVTLLFSISALINITSNNIVDRAAQEIVTAIREAQNKSISVASDPLTPSVATPLAWGVYVNAGTKSAQPFYLEATSKTYKPFGTSLDYSSLKTLSITGDKYYFFTTPFGKYYSKNNFPAPADLGPNPRRPYDIIPSTIDTKQSTITLVYRNSAKTIIIETNGDVHVQ